MNKQAQILTTLIAVLVFSSCGKKANDSDGSDSINSTEASIESGLSVMNGSMDDQAGSSFASLTTPSKPTAIASTLYRLALPEAEAVACSRAVVSSCTAGVKSALYNACDLANTLFKMSGQVNLTYSQSDCSLNVNGDTVTRTYSVSISGPRSGTLTLSSNSASDYNGATYGGGGRLTKTASGWNIDVLGKHKSFSRRGFELFNISMRTTSPWQVTGSLSRASRVVNSGVLEINHNLAKFTMTVTPNNLQYSASCCHPVSGSLNVGFSGSKTGNATVSFQSCGVASLLENGQTTALELSYCE